MSSESALLLLRRYGRDAVSFQALTSGCQYWFTEDACVAYVEHAGAWVAVGSPIAAPARHAEVAASFVRAARARGKRARFFGTEEAWSEDLSSARMQVGAQPIWDPAAWPGGVSPKLQRQLRQHRARARVQVRELASETLSDARSAERRGIDAVTARWLESRRMAPLGFLVRINLYEHAAERRYFVAEHHGKVVCVMIAMPIYARGGWLLETFMRDPAAPSGAMELLFDFVMRSFAAEGCEYVSFGLCPLTGSSSVLQRLVRRSASGLYDFDGLRHFKNKLSPSRWLPVYLSYPRSDLAALCLLDAARAFCPESVLAFGARSLFKVARARLSVRARDLTTAISGGWQPQGPTGNGQPLLPHSRLAMRRVGVPPWSASYA